MGVALLAAACTRAPDDEAAARRFVQDFYDWYVLAENAPRGTPADWRVLDSRPEVLDSALLDLLRADSALGDRGDGRGTREAINFDPFLASQDPCPRYEVDRAVPDAGGFRVTVRPVCADTTWQTQRPMVAVAYRGTRWQIVNVFYERGDLRSLLCAMARRDTTAARSGGGC